MRHVVTLSALLFSTVLHADSAQINAQVQVIAPVSVTGERELNFGTLTQSPYGETVWKLAADGALSRVRGTGEDLVGDDHRLGQFQISGEPGTGISIGVSTQDASSDGLRVTSGVTYTSEGKSSSQLPASGELMVSIGGRLTIGKTATVGRHTIGQIRLMVNY